MTPHKHQALLEAIGVISEEPKAETPNNESTPEPPVDDAPEAEERDTEHSKFLSELFGNAEEATDE